MLYYTILFYGNRYYDMIYNTMLYSIILLCNVLLCYTLICCSILYYTLFALLSLYHCISSDANVNITSLSNWLHTGFVSLWPCIGLVAALLLCLFSWFVRVRCTRTFHTCVPFIDTLPLVAAPWLCICGLAIMHVLTDVTVPEMLMHVHGQHLSMPVAKHHALNLWWVSCWHNDATMSHISSSYLWRVSKISDSTLLYSMALTALSIVITFISNSLFLCICNLDPQPSNQVLTLVVLSLLLGSGLLPLLLLLFLHWWVMWPCNKPLSYGLPFNWDAALAWCPMVSGMQSVLPLLH